MEQMRLASVGELDPVIRVPNNSLIQSELDTHPLINPETIQHARDFQNQRHYQMWSDTDSEDFTEDKDEIEEGPESLKTLKEDISAALLRAFE